MSTSEAVENYSEEATFRSKEADEAEPRCAGLGAAWSWARGGTFFGPALLAASCVGAAVLMEAEWWMTFSLKRFPFSQRPASPGGISERERERLSTRHEASHSFPLVRTRPKNTNTNKNKAEFFSTASSDSEKKSLSLEKREPV